MSDYTFDQDAIQQAITTFRGVHEQTGHEIGRRARLASQLDNALYQARQELWRAQLRQPASEQLWNQVGMSWIASDCVNGRHAVEEMRLRAGSAAQQLLDAHPGSVGALMRRHTDPVGAALAHAVNEYWHITNRLHPGNTISLAQNARQADELFGQVGYWLGELSIALDQLLRILDRLISGETALVAELLGDGGAGPALGLFAPVAGASAATTAGSNGPLADTVWGYLSSRYKAQGNVGFSQDGNRRRSATLEAGVDVEGDLWHVEARNDGKLIGLDTQHTTGIALGVLAGSAGLNASLNKGKPGVGVSGEFTAAEIYDDNVLGSKQFGLTDETKVKALSAEGFAGYENGELGAKVGVDFVSVEGNVGVNVAGANVGLDATIGLKAELGFKIGPKTEVNLPFVSFGLTFGGAK